MDFEKKTWVNVPDPSQLTEDELSKLPCFDADNMNRIEDNAKLAYEEAISTKYVDGLIDYLNKSPLTLRRDDAGNLVYPTVKFDGGVTDKNIVVPSMGNTNTPISAINLCSFDYVKSIDYEVPIFNMTFTLQIKCQGNRDNIYFNCSNLTIKIKNSLGNIIWSEAIPDFGFDASYNQSYDNKPYKTFSYNIPWGDIPSDTYSFDVNYDSLLTNSHANNDVTVLNSTTINTIIITHNLRDIIEYPATTTQ